MRTFPLVLRLAAPADLSEVRGLAVETTEWLRRNKDTDQWAKPWPDSDARDERLLRDLTGGKTWIAWDGAISAGTITIDTSDPVDPDGHYIWPEHKRLESALYVHRVIVRRSHAGRGLGAELFDWASEVAMRKIGTPLIRVDVWTDNWDLHAYYRRQGFTLCEFRDPRALPGYPSRALFERRTSPRRHGGNPSLFTEQ